MKYYIIIQICCCTLLAFSQTTFQKELSLSLKKPLIRLAEDGNVYVAGFSQSANDAALKLLKIDANTGNLIWQKEYDGQLSAPQLTDFLVQKNGVVLAISDAVAASHNAYLMKTDFQGKVIWNKKIGKENFTQLFDIEEDNVENIWISALQYPQTTKDTGFYFTNQLRPDGAFNVAKQTRYRFNQFFSSDDFMKSYQMIWNPKDKMMWSIMDETAPYCRRGNLSWVTIDGLYNAFFLRYKTPDAVEWLLQRMYMEQYMLTAKGSFVVSGEVSFTGMTAAFDAIAYYDITKSAFTKVRKTDYVFKLIDKYPDGIIVYDEKQNIIIKMDEDLNTIWKTQIDKCLETSSFVAAVLPDGSIFSLRNIKQKTILAKFNAAGVIENCATTTFKKDDFEKKPSLDLVGSSNLNLLYDLNNPSKNIPIKQTDLTAITKDFCLKADATFGLPDSVCLGFSYQPMIADTSSLLKHIWQTPNKGFDDQAPILFFDKKGIFKIKHDVQVGICRDTVSRIIKVLSVPKLDVKDTVVCGKSSLSLNISHPDALFYFNDGKAIFSNVNITQSGIYKLKIKNTVCADSVTIKVKIVDFSPPFSLPSSPICSGEPYPIVLQDFSPIVWDGQVFSQDTFFITDAAKHLYKATYTKDTDCKIAGEIMIARKKCKDSDVDNVYVPTTFSPNNDGFNDFFKPQGKIILHYLSIFDRWGNQIFESKDSNAAWDGTYRNTNADQSVYAWLIRYFDLKTGEEKMNTGDLMLLR